MASASVKGPKPAKGRGANLNPARRFGKTSGEAIDDGWNFEDEDIRAPETTVLPERAKTVLTYNDSPDIGLDRSVNPFRGQPLELAFDDLSNLSGDLN